MSQTEMFFSLPIFGRKQLSSELRVTLFKNFINSGAFKSSLETFENSFCFDKSLPKLKKPTEL